MICNYFIISQSDANTRDFSDEVSIFIVINDNDATFEVISSIVRFLIKQEEIDAQITVNAPSSESFLQMPKSPCDRSLHLGSAREQQQQGKRKREEEGPTSQDLRSYSTSYLRLLIIICCMIQFVIEGNYKIIQHHENDNIKIRTMPNSYILLNILVMQSHNNLVSKCIHLRK